MANNKDKKIFLTQLAKDKNIADAKQIVTHLLPYKLIYTYVENATLSNPLLSMDFVITDIPVSETYLEIILSKGEWTGNVLELKFFNDSTETYDILNVCLNEKVSISVSDLFVYEEHLENLLSRNLDLLTNPTPVMSVRSEDTLYAVIGALMDMLVDKRKKNKIVNPTTSGEYIFPSQARLIVYIANQEIRGLGETNLETILSKANSSLAERL